MEMNLSWKKLWKIVAEVELYDGSSDIAMDRLVSLLKEVPGQLHLKNNQLYFVPNQYEISYKYSTSIIGSEDEQLRVQNHKHMIDKKLEEEAVIAWMLDHINDEFEHYDEMVLEVFIERYISNQSVGNIRMSKGIGSKKYYLYIETAEYLFKNAMLIFKPNYQWIKWEKKNEKISENQ